MLHVGIVGLGGTGSAVCEQLIRLGVAKLAVCDPQTFESTNINRVYGSHMADGGAAKAMIAERQAETIGLHTDLLPLEGAVTELAVAEAFRQCDIIVGCTDDEWGRAVLTRLATYYLIPVFDLGGADCLRSWTDKKCSRTRHDVDPGLAVLILQGNSHSRGH